MNGTDLADRIGRHTARIAVIGQGYVGLPLAVEFARAGFVVTGLDTDADRIARLTRGESYIPDVPAEDLQQVIEAGRYVATADVTALVDQDAVILCVPTPLRKSKDPDVSHVVACARDVASFRGLRHRMRHSALKDCPRRRDIRLKRARMTRQRRSFSARFDSGRFCGSSRNTRRRVGSANAAKTASGAPFVTA